MPNKTDRIPTGITGLDKLIEGGFVPGSANLISGSPGTGKSIFGMQYIHTGATKFKERGLYISFEQRIPEIYDQAKRFGWDFASLEKRGLVKFIFIDMTQRVLDENETYIGLLQRYAKHFKPKRIVIDSLVPLSSFPVSAEELEQIGILKELDRLTNIQIPAELLCRIQIHKLIMALKDTDKSTSVLISEIPKESKYLSGDQVSEFMCDSVFVMHFLGIGGDSNRSLMIEKMRGTKHCEDVLPMEITNKGIRIKAEDRMSVIMK